MTLDELKAQLREWGHWYGERTRPPTDEDGYAIDTPSTGTHPLARAMEYAPGRHADEAIVTLVRTRSRRERMAEQLTACGVRVVPPDYVDAVPCIETRPHLGTPRWPTQVERTPPDVVRIEWLVRAMIGSDPAWGYALRARYCRRGEPVEKAAWVAGQIGKGVTVRAYTALLDQARHVLLGQLRAQRPLSPPENGVITGP